MAIVMANKLTIEQKEKGFSFLFGGQEKSVVIVQDRISCFTIKG
jgi:hypothetical protein